MDKILHVIAVVSNPMGFESRYRLYRDFAERMKASPNVHFVTVEHAFGDRPFVITEAGNPDHVQVRSSDVIWLKESLINIGMAHLSRTCPDWKFMAWIDADISFDREDWAGRTLRALEYHPVVQMFHWSKDLGPDGVPFRERKSFAAQYVDLCRWDTHGYNDALNHTGYAWAARRDALDAIGGLVDWDIIGSADWHMAFAMVGKVDEFLGANWPKNYVDKFHAFQERCERYIRRNMGVVNQTVTHYWHGSVKDRKYETRWRMLVDNDYNPDLDIIRDTQGLIRFAGNKPALEHAMRQYFAGRNEDAK